jgi:putative endonuclease
MAAPGDIGRRVEETVCRYLEDQGLILIERNYRGPQGEIDLIMQDADSVVFVEIRYRRHSRFGAAVETVDRRKQSRVVATAMHFLQSRRALSARPARFDVVSVAPQAEGNQALGNQEYRITWIADAFQT